MKYYRKGSALSRDGRTIFRWTQQYIAYALKERCAVRIGHFENPRWLPRSQESSEKHCRIAGNAGTFFADAPEKALDGAAIGADKRLFLSSAKNCNP